MKTASVQQARQQWAEILQWDAAGEEEELVQQARVVSRLVPPAPAVVPDFVARAKRVWGEQPPGKPLSELVSEARGDKP